MVQTNNKALMSLMTFLFFMWGFITCLNDVLVPHLKLLFDLNYTEALLIQFCFFLTYAVMSIPLAKLVTRFGYKVGIVFGLVVAAAGCMMFLPAASYRIYALFLLGLFILASGIVALQVAANPCVTLLGESRYASSRLTFAQAVNSLGYTIAPLLVGSLILRHSVDVPYFFLALTLLLLTLIIAAFAFPKNYTQPNEVTLADKNSVWKYPQLVYGALAIFVYVGAEVSAGSLLVNYLGLSQIANMAATTAAKYLSIYWGGAMVGRFIGTWILARFMPNRVISFNAIMAMLLLITVVLTHGAIAMWAVLLLGLFNSVMFPTIFALAIDKLGKYRDQAAGILCAAIVGGAIIPELQGMLADKIGLQNSYGLLIICYLVILFYGWRGYQSR